MTQQLRRLARRVGWHTKKAGLHSLRATWASDVLTMGAAVHEVQQAGGWSSLAAVQHYAGAGARAMERIARMC